MRTPQDYALAMGVANWLRHNGCQVTIVVKPDEYEVHYTLSLDVKPQPPVHVHSGKIRFPQGSQEAVVLAFLTEMGGEG